MVHQQILQRRHQHRSMHGKAQQQVHSSKDTLISRGSEDEQSAMQHSSPMAPATQQTAVRTAQDTLRKTITSREVSDGRPGVIIQESARLAVTGSRQTLTVPLQATVINTTGGNTHASDPRRTSKRWLADMEADRAATEITDLVEQEGHHLIRYKPKEDRDISEETTSDLNHDSNHKRTDQEDDKAAIATEGIIPDDCAIPE